MYKKNGAIWATHEVTCLDKFGCMDGQTTISQASC